MSQDHCCYWCRSPFGCMNHQCQHHKDAQAQEDANDRARRTIRRPTEDKAIANVMRANRKKGRPR